MAVALFPLPAKAVSLSERENVLRRDTFGINSPAQYGCSVSAVKDRWNLVPLLEILRWLESCGM